MTGRMDAAGFAQWVSQTLLTVEASLDAWVPDHGPAGLGDAMRYAVLDGGKRLRPLLVCGTAEAIGGQSGIGKADATLRAACAVELIHAYSLVHDDLPCMDNDVLRRGKPTVHVRYGEAQALLAGDALQALAFELLLDIQPADVAVALGRRLAVASGYDGMAGGQAIDLAGVGKVFALPELEDMHRRKTGALLLASVTMGATVAKASSESMSALRDYGQALGLAFQVVDDVLDVVADSSTLGKTAGKDAASDKPTFVSLLGLNEARDYAAMLLKQAHESLDRAQLAQPEVLRHLADWVVGRTH